MKAGTLFTILFMSASFALPPLRAAHAERLPAGLPKHAVPAGKDASAGLVQLLNTWAEVQDGTGIHSHEQISTQHQTLRTSQGTILFASRIFGRSGVGTFGATSSVYLYSSTTAAHHDFARYGHGAGLLGSGMDVVFRRSESIGDKGFLVGYEENGQTYQNNGAAHFSGGAVIWILGKYIGITSVHSFNVAGGYHQNALEALNLSRDVVRRMKR